VLWSLMADDQASHLPVAADLSGATIEWTPSRQSGNWATWTSSRWTTNGDEAYKEMHHLDGVLTPAAPTSIRSADRS